MFSSVGCLRKVAPARSGSRFEGGPRRLLRFVKRSLPRRRHKTCMPASEDATPDALVVIAEPDGQPDHAQQGAAHYAEEEPDKVVTPVVLGVLLRTWPERAAQHMADQQRSVAEL